MILFSKTTTALLNSLAIALIVAGCFDFALIGHSLARSRIYLVAALGTLILAALVSGVRTRREGSNQAQGASEQVSAAVPLWNYLFVVLCFTMAAITATTHLIESKITDLVIVAIAILGVVAVVVSRARANAKLGLKFSPLQKVGMVIGLIGLVSGLIRLVIML